VLFSPDEVDRFLELQQRGIIPPGRSCAIFVLGRYTSNQQSLPRDLEPFLEKEIPASMDWFVCAFGKDELSCLEAAVDAGGHARIGFENNIFQATGEPAQSTASQVSVLVQSLISNAYRIATPAQARELLFSGM
jgi:uncharacterized protein (DUF849 family)